MLSRASGRMKMWHSIPWAWHLSVNCKRNSFFRIHPSQSTFYEDHCLIYSWDRWQKRVCLLHKSLLHSSRSFLFQIFWRPLPAYLLSPFLDCKPHWDSIGNHLHFSDVGIKRSHFLSHQRHTTRKQKNSLHWCSHWWWCLTPYLLSLPRDEWLPRTWTSSISVVRKVLISKFLTVNDFILKLDVSQLLGELCFVRSYHSIACRCKLELEKELIRKNSWKEDSMILQNLMIQLFPIFVSITIIELILHVNSWFFFIFSIESDLPKINRLNSFSELACSVILRSQE